MHIALQTENLIKHTERYFSMVRDLMRFFVFLGLRLESVVEKNPPHCLRPRIWKIRENKHLQITGLTEYDFIYFWGFEKITTGVGTWIYNSSGILAFKTGTRFLNIFP